MSDPSLELSSGDLFTYGVAELARAEQAVVASPGIPRSAARPVPRAAPSPPQGFDPYNSTGGFDRRNAWKSIRKR